MQPLTPEQAGIWFTEELGQAATVYHLPLTVDFSGPLDTDRLAAAWARVVVRHPVLAQAVRVEDGVPFLVPAPAPLLRVVDTAGGSDTILARITTDEMCRPFDRAAGPLARAAVVRAGPELHRLVVVVHHLVFDGSSKDILLADLAHAYAGGTEPVEPPADPAPLVENDDAARRYWADRWRPPEPVQLPGDRPRAGANGADDAAGAFVPVDLGDLGEQPNLGATRFELILTALRCLLLRYGNDRATVAVDVSTRTPAQRDRIGMYVNQLPLIGAVDTAGSFRSAVVATRGDLRELYRHRWTPVSRVVDRVPAGSSLAPVSVSYRRRSAAPTWPDGLVTTVDWAPFNLAAPAPLHLQIVDGPDGVAASLRYRTRSLSGPDAERVSSHLTTLLASGLSTPDAAIGDLGLLGADERDALVQTARGAEVPAPQTTLDRLLSEQVRRTPDAVAVVSDGEGRQLTYAELDQRAERLARQLWADGVVPGVPVGVFVRRGIDLVCAAVAVVKAGGVYVPLDPDQPDARLAFLVGDAGATVVLASGRLAARLPDTVRVRPLEYDPEQPPAAQPVTSAAPGDPAYLIYTSGSTGEPKGVRNTHRGLVNRLDWMQREYRLTADDVVLHKTPIGFDVSLWELFWPLLTGARLVVARPDGHRDPRYLRQVITAHAVTTVHFVPSMLAAFLDEPDGGGCADLRRTICSGEALGPDLARRFLASMPGELHNLYGPTEAAIDVSAWFCTPDALHHQERLPIGRPIQNMRLDVVDRWGNLLPAGLPGELTIAGPGVALGYLNQPELTALRFPADPVAADGSARYRTGDLARYRADGQLEYLGRMDRQIKLRGNRIEPGEIEAVLHRHPAVGAAAVVVDDSTGERRLVAAITTTDPQRATLPARLREHLAARLPDYLVPAAFAVLDQLPVTVHGKLDENSIVENARRGSDHTPAPPPADPVTDGIADEIAAIWREVLSADRIGPDDDLFDLGGHSLTVTQIAARMRQRLGIDLPLHVFYDRPTITGLVAAADHRGGQP